ncbi:hypothetical protein BZA05DRAFT_346267 [Tricharina praecox]|uniref:uncharacterized protein n=1 Tax=Tricharina praecox TaxID=43433 RepID=UPI0022202455|nr:uncharacterized protein BZA05DRAFT_346267 [Tricharina praecox]KAI5858868.1 hypothetical protein BZA05DRAFT_346267 [Tricharina praecox]
MADPSPPPTKKRRLSSPLLPADAEDSEESTDTKLALLLSLHPTVSLTTLLETLLASNGSVHTASLLLSDSPPRRPTKQARQQSSLSCFLRQPTSNVAPKPVRPPKKGETLHLYTPASIAYAPCPVELIQSFLPPSLAISLLRELLEESNTFPPPLSFRLFDREVTSPHTSGFFLRNPAEDTEQYHSYQSRPLMARAYTPSMRTATKLVEDAVNAAITARYEGQKKPWGLSPIPWSTNAALVNRYQGAKQAVGWHTDEVTYLGPMAVIAGLSLGVEREFRVRRASKDDEEDPGEGAYAVHLPHNSLVIMHAGMQEAWKHCVHPVRAIDLHPVSADVRINITYRCYRRSLKPELTPRCKCNLPMTLRAVFSPDPTDADAPRRYFWNCAAPYRADTGDGKGCGFFEWAQFDEDGEPVRNKGVKSD